MPRPPLRAAALGLLALLAGVIASPAAAQIGSSRYAAIVVEAGSGRVLLAHEADAPRHPASLTKMMTAYMVFEAVRGSRVHWSTPVAFSAHAAAHPPSKLGLPAGSRITLEQALLAIITRSANDAAAAIAETLGGTEANFARLMTLRARQLGMRDTVFRNASGLPDPAQITTARDMATLGLRLLADFPAEYRYFSTESFSLRGRIHRNHNRLLASYDGADGIKTGYIRASGFNVVTSATRNGRRLVGVVLGGASAAERDQHMADLLDQAFGGPIRTASAAPPIRLVARAQAAPARDWAVQVGAFRDRGGAVAAARAVARQIGGGAAKVEQARLGNRTVWRAQVVGLSEGQARQGCADRQRRRQDCAVVAPAGTRQTAASSHGWVVRLGVYRDRAGALAAVRRAEAALASAAPTPKVTRVRFAGRPAWRAEVENLTRAEARRACAAWPARGPDCVTVAPIAIASAASDRG
jgi:D-alanyl-D-alanine carboxypeptidase